MGIMRAKLFGLALIATAGAAPAAEPAKPSATDRPTPEAPAKVVLAAANDARSQLISTQTDGAPPKRRIARVTTCRCGDPQAAKEQPDQ